MSNFYSFFLFIAIGYSFFFKTTFSSYHPAFYSHTNIDTVVNPVITAGEDDIKVVMSTGDNSLEFSPLSSLNNGLLIQPINRVTNQGISSIFYLRDTSSWSFYTNAQERFSINGNGVINAGSPLLINNAINDGKSALRINGSARFDTSIYLQANTDTSSLLSFHRNIQNETLYLDDSISPYTSTPTTWAAGQNLPGIRIRHPNNVTGIIGLNTSIQRDFLILPYQYGMAIEYNGVVECWVGEWSIHKGVKFFDVEGKGNGWGAVSWVGDDQDLGGIRATARNNLNVGGNVNYGEFSVEKFSGVPNGDLRFRLPSTQNEFHFVYGERGSENIIAKMTNQGLVLPKISSIAAALVPQKAQIVFDSTDNQFKGFNGADWVSFESSGIKTGTTVATSNGTEIIYAIPHGLTLIPSYYNVIATSEQASNISYVTANNTQLLIHYVNPPVAGENNLSWNWQVKK